MIALAFAPWWHFPSVSLTIQLRSWTSAPCQQVITEKGIKAAVFVTRGSLVREGGERARRRCREDRELDGIYGVFSLYAWDCLIRTVSYR